MLLVNTVIERENHTQVRLLVLIHTHSDLNYTIGIKLIHVLRIMLRQWPPYDILGAVSSVSDNVKVSRKLWVIIYSFSFHNPVETHLSSHKQKKPILGMFKCMIHDLQVKISLIYFMIYPMWHRLCSINPGSGFESIIYHSSEPIQKRKRDIIRKRREGCKTKGVSASFCPDLSSFSCG